MSILSTISELNTRISVCEMVHKIEINNIINNNNIIKMSLNQLEKVEQYLTDDDYHYLIQYIENIKNDIPNDKMIILCGPGGCGKTTLINHIQTYLGKENYDRYPMSGDIIYIENIKKLVIIPFIDSTYNNNYKKNSNAILNLIKYKQSIITVAYDITKVNKKLLEYSRIITPFYNSTNII